MIGFKASVNRAVLALTISVLTAPTAYSQVVDTSEWACGFCPFESGRRADFSAGASSVSDDSAYFGDASGYGEEGVYADIHARGTAATNNHQLRWAITDLGLDSRAAALAGGRQGSYGYEFAYRQLPRHQFFTTDSIFVQSTANTLSLPAGWVRAPLSSGFTGAGANLVSTDIESERRTLEIGGEVRPTSHFRVSANYSRQEKDGNKVFAGSYFTQASLLPGPIDYVTDQIDVDIRYAGERGLLSLAWHLSDFDNGSDSLAWETPFTTAPGAEFAALAQAPDNKFQQISLSWIYRFSKYDTIVAISGATGRIDQDALFLPYTTNASLNVAPLPRSSLNADVDTSNFAFNLTSKLHRKARVKLTYRFDERDSQTARDIWTRVIADSFLSGESETNTPYSFERSALSLSADYKLFDTVRLSGGYDRRTVDRDFQEVAEQTEDSGWGRLRWRPNRSLDIAIRGGASERDIDRYNETFAAALGQNPLLRKYNLAYRYRQFAELALAYSPPDSSVAVTLNGLFADDDYTQSQLGITAGDDLRLTADLSWLWSENTSLYMTVGYEDIESRQSGSELFAFPDWNAVNNDEFTTAGGGFRVSEIGDKYDLRFDYTHSKGTSGIDVVSAAGGLSQFPDLKSRLDYLRLQLSYRHSNRLELTASLRLQRFSTEDWALEGVGPTTIPVVLTLGAQPYDDEVYVAGIGFRYLIGDSQNGQ